MVAGRTANCEWLMHRLGADAGELHRRIVTEVRAMGHHKAEALRYAYGFDMTDKLRFTKYRREAYIATLDEWKSIDTIIGWEDDAIGELLERLLGTTPQNQRELHITLTLHDRRLHTVLIDDSHGDETEYSYNANHTLTCFWFWRLPEAEQPPDLLSLTAQFYGQPPQQVHEFVGHDSLTFYDSFGLQDALLQSRHAREDGTAIEVSTMHFDVSPDMAYGLAWD